MWKITYTEKKVKREIKKKFTSYGAATLYVSGMDSKLTPHVEKA